MVRRPRERPWMRAERWVIVAGVIIVTLMVLAAVGYMTGGWWESTVPE